MAPGELYDCISGDGHIWSGDPSIEFVSTTPPYPLSVDGDSSLLIAREVEDVDSTDLGIHVSRFEQLIEQLLGKDCEYGNGEGL